MFRNAIRATCVRCRELLPRAAYLRCPLCHEPIERAKNLIDIICRRCDRAIPKGHVGACLSCNGARARKTRMLRNLRGASL